jgi:HlyD family secretion protein
VLLKYVRKKMNTLYNIYNIKSTKYGRNFMSTVLAQRIALFLLVLLCCSCSKENAKIYSGYVEAKLLYLSNPHGGKLQELPVSRGQAIKTSQKLFVLDPNPEQLDFENSQSAINEAVSNLKNLETGMRSTEIAAIEAQIEQVTKELAFYEKEADRYKKLFGKGATSHKSYDEASRNYFTTKARLTRLQADLGTAKLPARPDLINAAMARVAGAKANSSKIDWILSQKSETSPQDGVIYDTYYDIGEYVPPGKAIVSLLVPNNIKVIFYVPQSDLSHLTVNQSLELRCDNCNASVPAKIQFISQVAEYTPPVIYSENSREKLVFKVEAAFSSPSSTALLPGQPVDIYLIAKKSS